jgi:F-type H+-transporting ATPase subunit gamma
MASLKSLKMRIGSVKSTQKITKAMKMVAAAKLRRAQANAEARSSPALRAESPSDRSRLNLWPAAARTRPT